MRSWEIIQLDRSVAENRARDLLELIREFPVMRWSRDNLLRELPGKWDVSLAALRDDGTICGLSVNSLKDDSLYIHLLLVARSVRGEGVGTALIARCRDLARRHDQVRCLRLRTTVAWTEVLKFYQRNGFVVATEESESGQYIMEMVI
jgi:GNAT superfamily N-acetyltransferase